MYIEFEEIIIRNAEEKDAKQLCTWWNDGAVMAHAGFPNGLGTTEEKIKKQISTDTDDTKRRHIIMYKGVPIGEMSYTMGEEDKAEIGIKICTTELQEKGLGTKILTYFINELFTVYKCKKIVLDTNVDNLRAQHVYEKLGFIKQGIRVNAWVDQVGVSQDAVDYAMTPNDFIKNW